MLRRLRRIIIEDSSEDDLPVSSTSTANCASEIADEPSGQEKHNLANKSLQEINLLSGDISVLSITERNTDCASSSDSHYKENDYYTSDESYEEDSFVVKDTSGEVEAEDCGKDVSVECLNSSEAEKFFPFSMQLRSNCRERAEVSLLAQQTTEVNGVSNRLLDSNSQFDLLDKHSNADISNISITKQSTEYEIGAYDSDDSYEIYIRRLKAEATKEGNSLSKLCGDDINNFVVDDEESVESISESESDYHQDDERRLSGDSPTSNLALQNKVDLSEKKNRSFKQKLPQKSTESYSKIDKRIYDLFSAHSSLSSQEVCFSKEEVKRVEAFLVALSPQAEQHPYADMFVKEKFIKVRDHLTRRLFLIYRKLCFGDELDEFMKIEWNSRLLKTAGRCICMKNYVAKIEMSVKICNRSDRVRDTLLHELCHAAVYTIDKISHGRHGPAWQKWVRQCMNVFPKLPVIQRCHQYSIDAKFHYICDTCGQTIKRHSKSLDPSRYRCGVCSGHFVLHNARGQQIEKKQKSPTPFAKFVQKNYKSQRQHSKSHAEVMKLLSQQFKQLRCCSDEAEEIRVNEESDKENNVFRDYLE